jgi:hypothetical protein
MFAKMGDSVDTQHSVDQPLARGTFDCGTHVCHQRLLETDGRYRNTRVNVSAIIDQESPSTNRITGHIRVPVVVHVVYNTEEQKVTMDQVKSQIDALNRDFNLQNKDIADVPSVWKDRIGNPNISFFLTKRDPKGRPHPGVVWVKTSVTQFAKFNEDMKSAEKGSPVWDRDRFLNVWVCNMEGLLGLAYYPGAKPELDGIMVQYNAFGTIRPDGKALHPAFNLGRTLVHEAGHWLDLPHTFDPDANKVSDTPRLVTNKSNFGKPLYPKISVFADKTTNKDQGGDMFMNYMDYTHDDTTIMFTKGQVDRMRNALTKLRTTVFWSNFTLQLKRQKTSFELTDEKTTFQLIDWHKNQKLSLVAIKTVPGQAKSTELSFTNNSGDLSSKPEIVKTTAPAQASDKYSHFLARWQATDERPSLFTIRRSGGSSKATEIEIFTAKSGWKESLGTMVTSLPETDDNWSFLNADWSSKKVEGSVDLVAIKKSNTINNKLEVHVLSASSNYTTWLTHKYTVLDEFAGPANFLLTDWNGDGTLDLVVIRKATDGSSFLVDILAGAADYRDFLVRTELKSAVLNTKVAYDFAMTDMTGDGRPDLVAIQKSGVEKVGTDTPKVQLIVLAG